MPTNYQHLAIISNATQVVISAEERRIADELVRRNPSFMHMEEDDSDSREEIESGEFLIMIPLEDQLLADKIYDKQGLTRIKRTKRPQETKAEKRKSNSNEPILLQLAAEEVQVNLKTEKKSPKKASRKSKSKRGNTKRTKKVSFSVDDSAEDSKTSQHPPVRLTLRLGRKKPGADSPNVSAVDEHDEWEIQQSAPEESPSEKRTCTSDSKESGGLNEASSSSSSSSSQQQSESSLAESSRAQDIRRRRLPPRQELHVTKWAYPLHAFVVLKSDIKTHPDRPRYIYRVCEDKLKRYNRIANGYQIDFLDVEGYENIMFENKKESNPDLFQPIDVIDSEAITVHLLKREDDTNGESETPATYEVHFEETLNI